MKIISPSHGHLTANERAAIQAILKANQTSGKVGRTEYWMRLDGPQTWSITIRKAGRGLGFIGEPLRTEQRTLKVEL